MKTKKRINWKSRYNELLFKQKTLENLIMIIKDIHNVVKIEANISNFVDKFTFTLKKDLELIKIKK